MKGKKGKNGGGGVDEQVISFALRERTMRRIMLTRQTLIKPWLVVGFHSWYKKGGPS